MTGLPILHQSVLRLVASTARRPATTGEKAVVQDDEPDAEEDEGAVCWLVARDDLVAIREKAYERLEFRDMSARSVLELLDNGHCGD